MTNFPVWTALEATFEKQVDSGGTGSPAIAKSVLAMIFLYNLAFNIGWSPLQVTYVVEILPYNLRARVSHVIQLRSASITNRHVQGLVLYNLFVACALIFNQYANPIALTAITWKCKVSHISSSFLRLTKLDYIVYDIWLFIELVVVYFLFVETSGSSLEEMSAIIDGEDARDQIIEGVARVTDEKAMIDVRVDEDMAPPGKKDT